MCFDQELVAGIPGFKSAYFGMGTPLVALQGIGVKMISDSYCITSGKSVLTPDDRPRRRPALQAARSDPFWMNPFLSAV
jgi:hypothetical protein